MRQNQLRARQKRRFVPRTTHSDPDLPIAPNWLEKVPSASRPDQIWVVDITYIPTAEGWSYLAVILDACSTIPIGEFNMPVARTAPSWPIIKSLPA